MNHARTRGLLKIGNKILNILAINSVKRRAEPEILDSAIDHLRPFVSSGRRLCTVVVRKIVIEQ